MKVIVFETEEWEHAACLRLQPEHSVVCLREPLDATRIPQEHTDAEVVTTFINSRLGADVLAYFSALKLIATRSTGYDHIDLDYCHQHGIVISNVPNYGDSTVAEHAFALLLAVSRHLVAAAEHTRRGEFGSAGLRGFELRGKTLGVVGTGRIGRRVIEIARGFGMRVVAFDRNPDASAAAHLGFDYLDLDQLLAASDVVTLHVSAAPGNRHLLGARELATMKKGSVLINTARGSLIDPAALVRVLTEGRLRGAGLDVLPAEPLIREEAEIFRSDRHDTDTELRALLADHALLRFPNVVVTPHVAFNTDEALQRILDTTLANIEAFACGTPQNAVSVSPRP